MGLELDLSAMVPSKQFVQRCSLPSRGSLGERFPPLSWYYEALRLPVLHPALLR